MMNWRHIGQFFLLQSRKKHGSGFRWEVPENSEHLHSLDVHVDAALAELVKAATGGLGLEVNARANLA